jgi:hypothetical protein
LEDYDYLPKKWKAIQYTSEKKEKLPKKKNKTPKTACKKGATTTVRDAYVCFSVYAMD